MLVCLNEVLRENYDVGPPHLAELAISSVRGRLSVLASHRQHIAPLAQQGVTDANLPP